MIKVLTEDKDYEFDSENHFIRNNYGTLEIVRVEMREAFNLSPEFSEFVDNKIRVEIVVFSTRNYIACIES